MPQGQGGPSASFNCPCCGGSGGDAVMCVSTDVGNVLTIGADGCVYLDGTLLSGTLPLIQKESFTQATVSPLAIFTPPANTVIEEVIVEVLTAAAAGTPQVAVGVSGNNGRDMDVTEVDLKTVGVYSVEPMTDVGGAPVSIRLSIFPSAQTFTGNVYVKYALTA